MNWFDEYWEALQEIIAAAWPEIPAGQLFQDISIERRDWAALLNENEMSVPWVVVKIDIQPTSEWGVGEKYIATSTIWYITSLKAAAAQGKTATSWITSNLLNLQQALYNSQTIGTIPDDIAFDINADNPVNASFLEQKVNFQGGSLTVNTVLCSN